MSSKKGWFSVGIAGTFYVGGQYNLLANVRAHFIVLTERRFWKIWTRYVLKKKKTVCVYVSCANVNFMAPEIEHVEEHQF